MHRISDGVRCCAGHCPVQDWRRGIKVVSVPFFINDLYGGFAVARGVLRSGPEDLVLEFNTKDNVVGLLSTGVKQVRIPIAEIESIRLQQRLGRATLRLRTMSMASVVDIPGYSEEGASLRIARRYRNDAKALVSEVDLRIAELRLDELDQQL